MADPPTESIEQFRLASTSSKLLESPERQNLVNEFLSSAFHAGIQAPAEGLAQLVDKADGGKRFQNMVYFTDGPKETAFLSSNWVAQQTGAAVGMLPWFLALNKGASAISERLGAGAAMKYAAQTESLAVKETFRRSMTVKALESGGAGLVMGGLLTPVSEREDNFWGAKLRIATSSAATFAGFSLTANSLKFGSEKLAVNAPKLANFMAHDITVGGLSGITGGLTAANSESLLSGKGLASFEDNAKAVTSFTLMGLGFGAVTSRLSQNKVSEIVATRAETNAANMSAGEASVQRAVAALSKEAGASRVTPVERGALSQVALIEPQTVKIGTSGLSAAEKALIEKLPLEKTPQAKAGELSLDASGSRQSNKVVSDTLSAENVRTIVKENGTRVTIDASGKVTVEPPPGQEKAPAPVPEKKVQEPHERRERHKPPDFSHLPPEQRPLNVGGSNKELVAAEMSNFEHSPFTLDGRTFGSVEAFYVWLKWSGSPEKQAQAQSMHGYEAKKFGKPAKSTSAIYDGTEIQLGSPEHHALLKRAMQAKLEQHPDLARRFAETHPREIIHDLGYPENPGTRLKSADFSKLLSELRQDLVDGKVVTKDGPVSELSRRARMLDSAMLPSKPVAEVLREAAGDPLLRSHPVEAYVRGLETLPLRVTRIVNAGADSIVMEAADRSLLKVTGRALTDRMGTRPFDLHIMERGVVDTGITGPVYWFTQPRAQTPVTYKQFMEFKGELAKRGFVMSDAGEHQLGIYNGQVKLLDPFAVHKLD